MIIRSRLTLSDQPSETFADGHVSAARLEPGHNRRRTKNHTDRW
jgi:hypothetical protein